MFAFALCIMIGYMAVLMLVLAHGWRNNAMMTYVEKYAFDGTGNIPKS